MKPIISSERANILGGLWTSKLSGDFEEGDLTKTDFFVSGHIEIKQLADHLKIFFKAIELVDAKDLQFHKARINSEDAAAREQRVMDSKRILNKYLEKEVVRPKLTLLLSSKKVKSRMTEIHKTGAKINLESIDKEGYFGTINTTGNFEVSLREIPDALDFKGLVAVKLPHDEPTTEEAIIYGLIKFQSAKDIRVKTTASLNFTDLENMLKRTIALNIEAENDASKTDNSSRISAPPDVKTSLKKGADGLKSLDTYRRMCSITWQKFEKEEHEKVNFITVLKMLQSLNIFMIEAQAYRIFQAINSKKTTNEFEIDLSEFETFIMAVDVLGTVDVPLLDIYDSLKVSKSQSQLQLQQKEEKSNKNEDSKSTNNNSNDNSSNTDIIINEGLDFSGLCEAIQMFDVKESERNIMEVFCSILKCKTKDIPNKVLTHNEFKKAWVRLISIEKELKKRKMKPDFSSFGSSRNRDKLLRYISDQEQVYLDELNRINEYIENVKQEKRQKKDEKRISDQEFRDKLLHEANKFSAIRSQEKRLLIKKEQEEKSKKRIEDKVLRNQLLLRQEENKLKKREEQIQDMRKKEKLRIDEIRFLGYDKMDYSVRDLRFIPYELYSNEESYTKLSYVVYMNFESNKIEWLPNENYFHHCASLKKLKLSYNRLHNLPNELCTINCLEILNLNSNVLTILPESFGSLVQLKRLDLSNNRLVELPSSIGNCKNLKYLNLHTNEIIRLPFSIGNLIKLEYLDLSRNKLVDLPEDFQFLINLVHFDIGTNELSHFPHNMGHCTHISYMNARSNLLTFLPESFSELHNLEICYLNENKIVLTSNIFNSCTQLKQLYIQNNSIYEIFSDIGNCINIQNLNFSNNKISILPPEIGLLTNLQELNLSYNSLVTIPPELGACIKLQKLNISYNSLIGNLPETIGLVHSLEILDFSFNEIETLPRSIIGLTTLTELICEGNKLQSLPDTITTLNTLQLINITNNNFKNFPIEISKLSNLIIFKISNNHISLLPRSINNLSYLNHIDISCNILRALPVEFSEILESVLEVILSSNPWNDFPPIWGKIMTNIPSIECPNGYRLSDAVDFMYGQRVFFNDAENIWDEFGAHYYSNRLGFDDFLRELEIRLPHSWHSGLIEYARYLYFKECGVFPRWYSLSEEEIAFQNHRKVIDNTRRAVTVTRVKEEQYENEKKLAIIYDREIIRRALRKEELQLEMSQNSQIKDRISYSALFENIHSSQEEMESSSKRIEYERNIAIKSESERLLTISNPILDERRLKSAKILARKTNRK
eukprot:gene6376-12890_t